ncbi:MAG TPA: methyltransferase domain-containing protein [Clostridia bacterium]|nr:methyltransferase domain-containing protein [Clostridia bacterium]
MTKEDPVNIPFWEDSYKDDSVSTFGTQPNAMILEFQDRFDPSWAVLDVGCGDGKNALYLAGLGFARVDAFDLSQNAIDKLHRLGAARNARVNAWVQDLKQFAFSKSYDLVMSFGTLHFVERACWRDFLRAAKANTHPHGIHIIQLFTNRVPASPDIAPFAVGLANDGEIQALYEDWEILQFKSYTFEDEHASNKIVARKAE